MRLLVADPTEGFARLRRDGDLTSPMLFGIIVSWICVLLSQLWNILLTNSFRGIFEGIDELEYAFRTPSMLVWLRSRAGTSW